MTNKQNPMPCAFCNDTHSAFDVKALRFDDKGGNHHLVTQPACVPCAKAMAMPTSAGVVDLLVSVRAAARRLGL